MSYYSGRPRQSGNYNSSNNNSNNNYQARRYGGNNNNNNNNWNNRRPKKNKDKIKKVMKLPLHMVYRFLQTKSRIQIWLVSTKICFFLFCFLQYKYPCTNEKYVFFFFFVLHNINNKNNKNKIKIKNKKIV